MIRGVVAGVVVGALALIAQACGVIAPLDDITPTRGDAAVSVVSSVPDAVRVPRNTVASRADAASPDPSTVAADMDAAAPVDAAAARAEPSPAWMGKTPCHPASQRNCQAGEHCALDEAQNAIRCVREPAGAKRRGEACARTSECAAGLECPQTHLCSSYCDSNEDCQARERCVPFENAEFVAIEGSGSCQTTCDPVSGEPCPSQTRCIPSVEASTFKVSVCSSTAGVQLSARGDSCHADSVVCEPRTACARYGPEVCAPICRTDEDCPAELPRCYVRDRLASVGDQLGDCWLRTCDESSVPEPAPWSEGPIATQAQLSECRSRCGARLVDDLACVQASCAQGLSRCLDKAAHACAAARGQMCRALLVAASCTDWLARIGPRSDLEACVAAHASCAQQAQEVCAGVR